MEIKEIKQGNIEPDNYISKDILDMIYSAIRLQDKGNQLSAYHKLNGLRAVIEEDKLGLGFIPQMCFHFIPK